MVFLGRVFRVGFKKIDVVYLAVTEVINQMLCNARIVGLCTNNIDTVYRSVRIVMDCAGLSDSSGIVVQRYEDRFHVPVYVVMDLPCFGDCTGIVFYCVEDRYNIAVYVKLYRTFPCYGPGVRFECLDSLYRRCAVGVKCDRIIFRLDERIDFIHYPAVFVVYCLCGAYRSSAALASARSGYRCLFNGTGCFGGVLHAFLCLLGAFRCLVRFIRDAVNQVVYVLPAFFVVRDIVYMDFADFVQDVEPVFHGHPVFGRHF